MIPLSYIYILLSLKRRKFFLKWRMNKKVELSSKRLSELYLKMICLKIIPIMVFHTLFQKKKEKGKNFGLNWTVGLKELILDHNSN